MLQHSSLEILTVILFMEDTKLINFLTRSYIQMKKYAKCIIFLPVQQFNEQEQIFNGGFYKYLALRLCISTLKNALLILLYVGFELYPVLLGVW